MSEIIRLVIEHPTRASNAREHIGAHARRVNKERDAVAAKWKLLAAGIEGLLIPGTIFRKPRGIKRDAQALAKKTGVDLRVTEKVTRPAGPLVVRLTRISPGRLDDDNLRAAIKGIRDQIAREMGVDDRDPLVRWDYDSPGQERGPRGYSAVRIEIERRAEAVGARPRQAALL